MQKTFLYLVVLVMAGIASYEVYSAALPTKFASLNYDAQAVVAYGYTTSNVLTPILVNSSGAVVTTSTP